MMNILGNRKEGGRSIIEMIGVLAIAALLTVGGVWGYRLSVDSHQANEILENVRYMAGLVIVAEENKVDEQHQIKVEEFEKNNSFKLRAVIFEPEGNHVGLFAVEANDVSKGVCEAILNKAKKAYRIIVNGAENNQVCLTSNRMQFLFQWTDTSVQDDDKED